MELIQYTFRPLLHELQLKRIGAPLRPSGTREYTIAQYIQEHGQPPLNRDGQINLSNKGLTSLDGIELIANPEAVRGIILSGNYLSNDIPQIPGVHLNPNANIPVQPFGLFRNLGYLILSNNKFYQLPEHIFGGLTSLRLLDLHYNQLSTLPQGIFNELTSLRVLYINDNQINMLPEGIFNGLTSLKELYIYSNQLSTLPERIFDNLTSLKVLEIRWNLIPGTKANFINTHQLFGLDRLEFIPQNLSTHSFPVYPRCLSYCPSR